MKHGPQTQFGRPVEARPTPTLATADDSGMIDKWGVLRALTDCADIHDLSHRTLGVLKALMTFLPSRLISPEAGSAIVFPSNRTLGDRLNGMPESTLRRHLARLVELGAITRHDSPNRKRYARRGRFAVSFGLDLSPLARLATILDGQAQIARQRREDLQSLRATVSALRHTVLENEGQGALTEATRQELRRKPCEARLTDLANRLKARIATFDANEMSANDSQNERHIQYVKKIYSDSEEGVISQQTEAPVEVPDAENNTEIKLHTVLQSCQAFQEFYPEPVRSWNDLISVADRIAPMIAIDGPVWQQAGQVMGYRKAAIVVLYILENLATIQNPGGYLRRMTQNGRAGGVNIAPLLAAIQRKSIIVS